MTIAYPTQHSSVTCPACGLLCDDLVVDCNNAGALKVSKNGCIKSVSFFERISNTVAPNIKGKAASVTEACTQAANILRSSNQALFAGLGTEVQGMRAVMSLADRVGATLDHMNSYSSMRNMHVVQNTGWQVTTLTEVRNRVDLLVVVGSDIVSYNPRCFERMVWNTESMFEQDTSSRQVVYLGGRDLDTSHGTSPNGTKPTVLPCDIANLPEVTAALRALVMGKNLSVTEVAGIALSDLQNLAKRLKEAKYGVVAWVSSSFDFNHAELTIQNITEMVVKINATTRCSGLPLGGSEGDYSVNQASTWTSGYPMRSSFKRGHPEFDPYLLSTEQLLSGGSADAVVWISSLNPDKTPPRTTAPLIVIGHPNLQFEQVPDVFIPIGTPGIDHKGVMFRIDSSVSLPLAQLKNTELPCLSEVIQLIEAELTGQQPC